MGGSAGSKELIDSKQRLSNPEVINTVALPSLGRFRVVQCNFLGLETRAFEKEVELDQERQRRTKAYVDEVDTNFMDYFVRVMDYHINDQGVVSYHIGASIKHSVGQSIF